MRTVLCAACWVTSAAAFAQGAFDMGMLSNTLSQGAVSGGGGGHKGHKGHKAPRRPLAKPSVVLFTPSQAVRKRAVNSLVAVYAKADPQFAKGLREEISSPAWWSSTEKEMRSYGLNPRNVADGMAVYLVQAWYGARGRVAKNPADYRAVGRQFALSLRSLPAAARLSNAAKQEMAEGFILQGVMVESFVKRAQKRPNEMPTAKANAIQGAKSLIGFDLTKLSLGANGLAPQ